ncbi:TonB-dependent receptor, partial [bacterium]
MRQQWYKFLLFLLLVAVLAATPALAANGKISGVVKSAEGEPVVGANVVLEGTALGTAADAAGRYFILNVPPGAYRVRASGVGFTPKIITNVRVNADQFVTLDISLQSQAVGLAEVVIEATRPPVDRSQTSAKTTMTGEDLQALPIRDARDLVATAASTYKGFVRGGKQYETKTIIDGVDMTDNFYAAAADQNLTPYLTYNGVVRYDQASKSSFVDPNVSSIEEANVLTGGIGSDYASATAGVVAYSLREGRGGWTGRADFRMSQTSGLKHFGPDIYGDMATYFSTKNTLAASGVAANIEKANRFTWTPNKYSYGEKPEMKAELALGGALGTNAGLYLTGGYFDTHGRMPNEFTRRVNASAKLNYNPSSDIKFNIVGMLEDRGQLFGWKNRVYQEDFRFFLEGLPKWDGSNLMGAVKMTHMLSKETFYELQASIVTDEQRRGYSDDNKDGVISPFEDGDFLTFADTAQVNRYMAKTSGTEFNKFFSPSPRNESGSEVTTPMSGYTNWKIARPGLYYDDLVNQAITLRGDLTSQISTNHQLRAGVMTKFNDIKRTVRAAYIGGYFNAYRNYVEEDWNVKPKEYSAYAQDRMEYAGLIINLGLRLDGYDFAASDYANWFAPFADIKDENGGDVRVPVRGESKTVYINGKPTQIIDPTSDASELKTFFSPRLGVSHPISDRAAMYFSFSMQHQPQPYSRMYANYGDFGNPSLPVVSRTNEDPI